MRRVNIADVASAAGVSKSTVSRVLTGKTDYMREETRERVEQTIHDLGYRPSSVARSLTSKRTLSVGLLISDVENPFYPEVIHGVEDVALAHGYNVFLCNTNYEMARGMKFVRSLADKQVDGALLMMSSMSDHLVMELANHHIPTVVLDWQLKFVDSKVGTIAVDFDTGIRAAATHLAKLGHRRISHVSGPLNLQTARVRRDIFIEELSAHDINPDQVAVVEGNFRIDGGRKALTQLLSLPKPPTAVFAGNDLTALGILWAARGHGLRIPEDLSVVGFDNIHLAAEVNPPLTTVGLHRHQIGSTAMQMLLDIMSEFQQSQSDTVHHKQVECQLVIRQSTSRPQDSH